jgi:hypothetical protein
MNERMIYRATRTRHVRRPCYCGATVTFTLWPGFKKLAEHIAVRCACCLKVHHFLEKTDGKWKR